MPPSETPHPSEAPNGPVGRLASVLAQAARVSTVFGEPIVQDGVAIVPVARARWGLGGGGGAKGSEGRSGGLGGGLQVEPAGYVVIRGGEAEYRPIRAPIRPMALLAALASGVLLARRR
jgi:uncharacterized spore protein YtfJ